MNTTYVVKRGILVLAKILGPSVSFRMLRLFAKGNHWLREHWLFGEIYEIVDGTIGDYIRDHGLMYAAAVSFYALLSLIPLVILFVSGAGYLFAFVGNNDVAQMDLLITEVLDQVRRGIPYISDEFERDLRTIIHNRRGLGLAGGLALFAASSQVFRALEFAFARIFARRQARQHVVIFPRNFFSSKLLFGGFIVAVMGIFLFLEIFLRFLGGYLHLLPESLRSMLFAEISGASVFSHLVTANVVVVGFTVLIKMFTAHRVQLRFAVVGGGSFYVLWQIARKLYELYIDRWTNLGALYGGFATLVEIVLWVFFSSTLLLLCGELVQTLQARILLGPKWRKGKRPARRRDAAEEVSIDASKSNIEVVVERE
ncbi:MAG: YihY/virulence factor BrkB family protein [Deltaproteobacteria bacterium]|nr:YihY/virulence factor BrkB family protein [Deltaproteobacteria bacterium]